MKTAPTLEKWIRFYDTFAGWVMDHPNFPNGTHCQTSVIRTEKDKNGNTREMIDLLNMEVHCADGMYKLGEPGLVSEHDGPGYLGDIWKPSLFMRAKKLITL